MNHRIDISVIVFLMFLCCLICSNCRKAEQATEADAQLWLDAIVQNDSKTAIRIANRIVATQWPNEAPNANLQYQQMAQDLGLGRAFITDHVFSEWDFQCWRDALVMKQIGISDEKKQPLDLPNLFKRVVDKIGNSDKDLADFPVNIWNRGHGYCDRQAWVLSEIAYQQGWETTVIYLRDCGNLISPHTICELRRGGGEVWVADPYSKVILRDHSIQSISKNPDLLKKIWPDNENWHDAIKCFIAWIPAYPQDYSMRNQILYKYLKDRLGIKTPRFGVDPSARLNYYRSLIASKNPEMVTEFPVYFWDIPYRVMHHHMKN